MTSNANPIFKSPIKLSLTDITVSSSKQQVVYLPDDVSSFTIDAISVKMDSGTSSDSDVQIAEDSSFTTIYHSTTGMDLDTTDPTSIDPDYTVDTVVDRKFYVKVTQNAGTTLSVTITLTLVHELTGGDTLTYYEQSSEPTLSENGEMAKWRDTDDDKVYLLIRRGSGDNVGVELD
jgi:hypothetical protein